MTSLDELRHAEKTPFIVHCLRRMRPPVDNRLSADGGQRVVSDHPGQRMRIVRPRQPEDFLRPKASADSVVKRNDISPFKLAHVS
jgi:hypothetical protein